MVVWKHFSEKVTLKKVKSTYFKDIVEVNEQVDIQRTDVSIVRGLKHRNPCGSRKRWCQEIYTIQYLYNISFDHWELVIVLENLWSQQNMYKDHIYGITNLYIQWYVINISIKTYEL